MTFLCLSSSPSTNLCITNTDDIDRIVHDGSAIFQLHIRNNFSGKSRYLLIDELPKTVVLRHISYNVNRSPVVYSGLFDTVETLPEALTYSLRDAILRVFTLGEETFDACFLTMGKTPGYTTAIRRIHSSDADHFCLFDSHSRNAGGKRTADGAAVLLEICSIDDLIEYITELSLSLSGTVSAPFEIVPVRCLEMPSIAQSQPLQVPHHAHRNALETNDGPAQSKRSKSDCVSKQQQGKYKFTTYT